MPDGSNFVMTPQRLYDRERLMSERLEHSPDLGPQGEPETEERPARIIAPDLRDKEEATITLPAGAGSQSRVRITARRYTVECHLDALNARGQLVDRLWRAGMKFRGFWLRARKPCAVTAAYGEVRSSSPATVMADLEKRHHAADEVTAAMDVLGRETPGWLALLAVAGEDEPCAGRLRDLQAACRTLADYYRVPHDYSRADTR